MKKQFGRSSPELAPGTPADDRVDLERAAEQARDLRARYIGQLMTRAIRPFVRVADAGARYRVVATGLRANVSSWMALLAPSRRRAYRG